MSFQTDIFSTGKIWQFARTDRCCRLIAESEAVSLWYNILIPFPQQRKSIAMKLKNIDREEFDRRLQQSTEQMRQKRLALEAQAAVLEDLIGQYSAVLERLEAQAEPEGVAFVSKRENLRHVLTELAERTSAIAATL